MGTNVLQKTRRLERRLTITGSVTLKGLLVLAALLFPLVITMTHAKHQSTRKWAIDFRKETGTLHMMLGLGGGSEYGRNEKYFSVSIEQLPGLSQLQIASGGPVNFQLKRDAGTFKCSGSFSNGNGSGAFEFLADPGFPARMAEQGFDHLSAETQLMMAVYNIDSNLVRQLRAQGYADLTLGQLIKIGSEQSSEPHAAAPATNVQPPPIEPMTGPRATSATLLSGLEALGYERPSAHQLAAMSTQGVSLNFVKKVNPYFSTRPSIDQLIGMRTQGITPAYLEGLSSLGYRGLTAGRVICLQVRGVSLEYIKSVQGDKAAPPSLRQLIMMRDPQGTAVGDCGPEAFPDE
jgi:hypothetical protein